MSSKGPSRVDFISCLYHTHDECTMRTTLYTSSQYNPNHIVTTSDVVWKSLFYSSVVYSILFH